MLHRHEGAQWGEVILIPMVRFSDLESITGGKMLRLSNDREISTLGVDSRKALPVEGTLFFAIAGNTMKKEQEKNFLQDKVLTKSVFQ